MKVTIMIPSCSPERIPWLVQTVESLQAGSYKNIHPIIISDGSKDIYDLAKRHFNNVTVILNKERKDWVATMNWTLKEFDSDYYIYAADDLIFPPDCITFAMAHMQKTFPDGFGVVSIGKKHRLAFGLFGVKWANHFPDRQVFCPDFIHYGGDSELRRTTGKMGKFTFFPQRRSSVTHHRLKDETWRMARGVRRRDHAIYFKREEMGLTWGVEFKLIAKEMGY